MAGLSAENPLRDAFNKKNVTALANSIAGVWPAFNGKAFLANILPDLNKLGFLERSNRVCESLEEHLPPKSERAIRILMRALPPELKEGLAPLENFIIWPQCEFVARRGRDCFDLSMKALYEMTKRFSAEGHLRYFIEYDYARAMKTIEAWIDDPNMHVRRLVSEGTRPRLPLVGNIPRFQKNPRPVIALLDRLKDDPEEYVRRSAANNLNDIARDNPDIAVATLKRWARDKSPERTKTVRHAARGLIKAGHPGALSVLGYTDKPRVVVEALQIAPRKQERGGSLTLSFQLQSKAKSEQRLVVDFTIHFIKANGKPAPKVFKLRNVNLAAGEAKDLQKKISLRDTSGRKIFPGRHAVEIIINGKVGGRTEFSVL